MGLAIRSVYPQFQTLAGPYGCFNRRPIAGTHTWSLHAEGRALDVGVPPALNREAWQLVCYLVDQRIVFGTMRVIWDRHIWSLEHGAEYRNLGKGLNPHLDHFHVEQFWAAALRPPTVQAEYEAALRRGP